jgi:hypothetical protein
VPSTEFTLLQLAAIKLGTAALPFFMNFGRVTHELWSRDAPSGATVVCIDPCSSATVIAQVLRQASCHPPLNLPKFGSNAWNASNEHSPAMRRRMATIC